MRRPLPARCRADHPVLGAVILWLRVRRIDKPVWELSAQEAAGNVAHGPAVFVNTRGSYVATEKQLVALLGAENLIVVTTADVVLVLFAATAARPAAPRCA